MWGCPEFLLNWERRRDHVVFSFVSQLLDGCGLPLRNSLAPSNTCCCSGTRLGFSVLVGLSPGRVTVHQGGEYCAVSPSCCPALGSDHFLCDLHFPLLDHKEVHGTHVDEFVATQRFSTSPGLGARLARCTDASRCRASDATCQGHCAL